MYNHTFPEWKPQFWGASTEKDEDFNVYSLPKPSSETPVCLANIWCLVVVEQLYIQWRQSLWWWDLGHSQQFTGARDSWHWNWNKDSLLHLLWQPRALPSFLCHSDHFGSLHCQITNTHNESLTDFSPLCAHDYFTFLKYSSFDPCGPKVSSILVNYSSLPTSHKYSQLQGWSPGISLSRIGVFFFVEQMCAWPCWGYGEGGAQ